MEEKIAIVSCRVLLSSHKRNLFADAHVIKRTKRRDIILPTSQKSTFHVFCSLMALIFWRIWPKLRSTWPWPSIRQNVGCPFHNKIKTLLILYNSGMKKIHSRASDFSYIYNSRIGFFFSCSSWGKLESFDFELANLPPVKGGGRYPPTRPVICPFWALFGLKHFV